MEKNSLVIRIGGEAGFGLAAAADILAKVFVKLGYHVFSSKEYASQIRGGHNYHTLRISPQPVLADADKVDILLAFDKEALHQHLPHLSVDSLILYDDKIPKEDIPSSFSSFALPVQQIGIDLREKKVDNTIFLGAVIRCLGIDLKILDEIITHFFSGKPAHIERNLHAAKKGYETIPQTKINFLSAYPTKHTSSLAFLSGNDAVSMGALKAGINFHVQYPMTPVSGILHYLSIESIRNKSLQVVQAEDEIAVINVALGASFAGARAMTATSGGGFCLMTESLGLASMAEIPLVIIEGQRPGPSTGLPTKTEQGDLQFVLHAAPGDAPRVVLAPGDIDECYTETKRAFYLAEKYQLPVIVLLDKYQAESFKTFDLEKEELSLPLDFSRHWGITDKVNEKELLRGMYPRYAGQTSFQRTLPGTKQGMYTCAGDEHDETGEIIEDQKIRIQMMKRRMGKLDLIEDELPQNPIYGSEKANLTVVVWGSTKGAALEAMEKLNCEGKKLNLIQIKFMHPFLDKQIQESLHQAKNLILIENNYSAQLGSLIREQTGIEITDKVLRYDGKTFTVDEIYAELKKRC